MNEKALIDWIREKEEYPFKDIEEYMRIVAEESEEKQAERFRYLLLYVSLQQECEGITGNFLNASQFVKKGLAHTTENG